MTAPWKIALDAMLVNSDVERWIHEAVQAGKLRKVRAGIFVNAAGNSGVSPAATAGLIRRSAIPSLSWVLEQN